MKRSSFISGIVALFGARIAAGATKSTQGECRMNPGQFEAKQKADHTPNHQYCPVRNGQCPSCGTMAEPFYKPSEWDYYPTGYAEKGANGKLRPVNIARCKTCNAAFWQDAEN